MVVHNLAGENRLPVVIDTDVAADDWMAMLYLLCHPRVQVLAVSCEATGEAHAEPALNTALGLLEFAGQPAIPVAVGRPTPLLGNHAFPDYVRTAVDEVMGLTLPSNSAPCIASNAVTLLTGTIRSSTVKAILVTLGPLTNVAEVVLADPDIVQHVQMVYVMGGAVDVPGNLGIEGNAYGEWNIYADPYAAHVVFNSGLPITLVPLDATNLVPLTPEFRDRFVREAQTAEARLVHEILVRTERYFAMERTYFWDPLAAAIAVDNSLGWFRESHLKVVYEEGPESGRTVAAIDGKAARVCAGVDVERFERTFIDVLNHHDLQLDKD